MKKESLISRFNGWLYSLLFGLSAIAISWHPQLEIQKCVWFIAVMVCIGLLRWECTR